MVSVIIPVHNAAKFLPTLLQRLQEQTLLHELILIDSESDEATQKVFEEENVNIVRIKKSEFNHGSTRNLGLQIAQYDIVIFLTQDALPTTPQSLEILVNMLQSRNDIAMAYGRQLPHQETGMFGRFARLTNYPPVSLVKTRDMIPKMGIKTCSCSNSFAAYKRTDLLAVGGFPTGTILGEDVSVAARFILQGKAIAYCAEAEVHHSHDYSITEEFKRYFDIGAFHNEQRLILSQFTQAESEGLKFVVEEWRYLYQNGAIHLIPTQLVRTLAKYLGYKLGSWEHYIPIRLKRKISMHSSFWQK